jgi:dipeptide/tripeptide permease
MLISERGMSPLAAGIALTGGALTWSFASWLQGREVFGRTTNLLAGTGAIGLGILLMSAVTLEAVPVAIADPSWIVAGFGMGLVYPTLSVLTLELSHPGEQGVNSSSLQVGEMVFSVVSVAVTSALFTATGSGYWTVFAIALLMALAGLWVAPRYLRPAAGTVETPAPVVASPR